MWECQEVPRLPRKTTLQLVLKPSKTKRFAAPPIETATAEENQRIDTKHVGTSKRAFCARHPQIFTLLSFKIDVFLRACLWNSKIIFQNRCFLRGLRQFSSHLTKRHECRGLCTLSPLRTALTTGFAKTTQHNTSEVPCLPPKMTLKVSKVLRLPRAMQLALNKRCENTRATQHKFWHVMKHIGMSRSATRAMQNETTRQLKLPNVTTLQNSP